MSKDTLYDYANLLKERLFEAIDKAIETYRKDYYMSHDFKRNRKLPLEKVILLMLTMRGKSLNKEFLEADEKVSVSAFSQQKKKIPWTLFEDILLNFNELCKEDDDKTYCGYHLLAVDGTAVNIARNPKSESFVIHSGSPNGYCALHLTTLYDVINHFYRYCVIQPEPFKNEVLALDSMLGWHWYEFDKPTVVIADRGFESYNSFGYFLSHDSVKFLVRVKNDGMRPIKKLPMEDGLDVDVSCIVVTQKKKEFQGENYIYVQTRPNPNKQYSSKTRNGRWDHQSPFPMSFRVVRFKIESGYETIATNLPRSEVSAEQIKEIYNLRWQIELSFRSLKHYYCVNYSHSRSSESVKCEIFADMIISSFCGRILNKIPVMKKTKHLHEADLTTAVDFCKQFIRDNNASARQLIKDITRYTHPKRKGRKAERNIRPKTFKGFNYRTP